VHRRPAPAQVVVVHRRQVVVDERVAVQQFEGGPGAQRTGTLPSEQARGLDDEERPQPLAAAERRVPHRREKAARAGDLARTGFVC
jgi:hypothetical protein